MFALQTPRAAYTDPWNRPLAARLEAMSVGRRRVAYYYETPDSSTYRYRAYNMVQALEAEAEGALRGACIHRADLGSVETIADLADVLVLCRAPYDSAVAMLTSRFRARGKPVLFDVDDLVFNPDLTHLLMDTLAVDKGVPEFWRFWFSMLSSLGATLKRCDAAITTNDHLARLIADYSGLPVATVPNFMNREQLEHSARIYEEKRERAFRGDDSVTFGYFSGSPSHANDLAIAEPALAELLDADARLKLMMVGYIEPGPGLRHHSHRILRQPFMDFVNLQGMIASVEYNLMPLQANAFTDGKSALKYFEAAAVGTVSIASPTYNYAAAIAHGRTGYLAQAQQWRRVVEQALAESDRYPAMAAAARDDAVAAHGYQGRAPEIARALEQV